MSYAVLRADGELVITRGFPSPERLTRAGGNQPIPLPQGGRPVLAFKAAGATIPNTIGTCLLVALGAERQPYHGPIVFTGRWNTKVDHLAVYTQVMLTDLHTAVRSALCGLASGHGPEFDRQAISTAMLATRGENP